MFYTQRSLKLQTEENRFLKILNSNSTYCKLEIEPDNDSSFCVCAENGRFTIAEKGYSYFYSPLIFLPSVKAWRYTKCVGSKVTAVKGPGLSNRSARQSSLLLCYNVLLPGCQDGASCPSLFIHLCELV